MNWLELKVPPLAVWLVCALAVVAAALVLPGPRLAFSGHRWLAAGLALAGAGVALGGVLAFRQARTTVNPLAPQRARTVVSAGVYRLTRNPMYLGLALLLLALVLWWADPLGLLAVAVFCAWMTQFQIKPEERALHARFGAEFERYRARVRRWL